MSEAPCALSSDGSTVLVSGTVDFGNFAEVRSLGEEMLGDGQHAAVNVGGLDVANSVAVALLLAWFRQANREGRSIVFVDVPRDLRNIIDFSGLSSVLPMGSGGSEPSQPASQTASEPDA